MEKLAPCALRENLLKASVFFAAFEFLKDSVQMAPAALEAPVRAGDKIVMTKFRAGRLRPMAEHLDKVREFGAGSDYLHGGALWLRKKGSLTDDEVEDLLSLRDYRNQLAHELAAFLIDPDRSLDMSRHARAVALLRKIDVWRVRLDVAYDEDYDGQDIKDEGIQSMRMMVTDLLETAVFESGGVADDLIE